MWRDPGQSHASPSPAESTAHSQKHPAPGEKSCQMTSDSEINFTNFTLKNIKVSTLSQRMKIKRRILHDDASREVENNSESGHSSGSWDMQCFFHSSRGISGVLLRVSSVDFCIQDWFFCLQITFVLSSWGNLLIGELANCSVTCQRAS